MFPGCKDLGSSEAALSVLQLQPQLEDLQLQG